MAVRADDGSAVFVKADEAQPTTVSLDGYLDSVILSRKAEEDDARVQEEAQQARQQFNANIAQNAAVPMGTAEAPVQGQLAMITDPNTQQLVPARDDQGNYIVETPEGQTAISEQDLAAKWGINLTPETGAQKDADSAAEYTAVQERKDLYNRIPLGTPVQAVLEGEQEPVTYQFTRAAYDDTDGMLKIYVTDENGEETWLPESAFPGLEQTASQYSAEKKAVDTANAVENGQPVDATPRDSKGEPLPMRTDAAGNQVVDSQALWNTKPEEWVLWNDSRPEAEREVDSRTKVENAVKQTEQRIFDAKSELQHEALGEMDGQKMDALRKAIADDTALLSRYNSLLNGIDAREKAAEEAATAAEEAQATAPVQAPAAAAEAPSAKQIETEQRMALAEAHAREWSERTGVKVVIARNLDEVTDEDTKKALMEGRPVTGWFNPETHEVGLYIPNNLSEVEVDKSFLHEVISHRGLRELLGDEAYDALCDRVWADLMSASSKAYYTMVYNRHLSGMTELQMQRAAADEWIARLSENIDFDTNRSLWEKFVAWVREFLLKRNPNMKISVGDLGILLRSSLANYEAQTKRGQYDSEVKREIGSGRPGVIETGEGKSHSSLFSVRAIADGTGLEILEDDGTGKVAFVTPDGQVFNADNHITPEVLKNLPDTVMSYMVKDAVDLGTVTEDNVDSVWKMYADLLNLMLDRGVPTNGLSGADVIKGEWEWYIEDSVYRSIAPNGDAQYLQSLDITRLCKKNEAVIKAISAMQSRVGYGLTPGQVMDIYLTTVEEGYQVPCPVCYVFSHYIKNGITATVAINGQNKYGSRLVDPATLSEQEQQKALRYWLNELNRQHVKNQDNKKIIEQAKDDCARIIERINDISRRITSGELTGEERKKAERKARMLDRQYKAAFNVVVQSGLTQWIKQFAVSGVTFNKDKQRYEAGKNFKLRDDTFQGFPREYALDLRLTAETIDKYPAIQRLRNARGTAGGKEIHFASNNDIGDVPMMLGGANTKNYYKLAANAPTQKERDKYLAQAKAQFGKARTYIQQQTLRGGQRMWSWSDNIERLAPDVAMNLMQLQLLGGALQSYSKQLEGVYLVASMGGYVNGSLMGYGKGYQELSDDDIKVVDGREVLSHDIKDTVTEKTADGPVSRERTLAREGSPVFDTGSGKVVLLFDDVVGIDAYGREDENGKHLMGLFDLNGMLDKAGNIIVGMNDTHVRAAMADDRIFFIIPWHASGNSIHIVQQMLDYIGVKTDITDYDDYTEQQEEKDYSGKDKKGNILVVPAEALDFWNAHNYESLFPCGIEGGIPSSDGNGHLSQQQRDYRALRDKIFDNAELTKEEQKQIDNDLFLSQVQRKVQRRVGTQQMTKNDKGFIYPYEYWDESTRYEEADINGKRYLEYCRRLGVKPKFTGKFIKDKGVVGNFADDKGYWKLLIDRRMYDTDGYFQDLDSVSTDGFRPEMVDPEWMNT